MSSERLDMLQDTLYRIDELADLLVDLFEKQRALIKAVKAERRETNWNEVIGVETNLDHLMYSIRNDIEKAIKYFDNPIIIMDDYGNSASKNVRMSIDNVLNSGRMS